MKVTDIDGYYMSISALNKSMKCDDKWFNRYVMGTEPMIASNPFPLTFGTRNHEVEQDFWNMTMEHGKGMFPYSYLKHVDLEGLQKRMDKFKQMFIHTFEDKLRETSSNLSYLDAEEFLNLRKHFDGNVEQAYEFWVPLEMEYDIKYHDPMVHIIIDHLKKIPARYRKYKNKDIALLVKDYKPGKYKDGKIKQLCRNADYDWKKDFQRQLTFYAIHVEYEIETETKSGGRELIPAECKHIAGAYYRTRQYVVDKIDNRQISPLRKSIDNLWNQEYFQRKKTYDSKHDDCKNWCDYRLTCRYTKPMLLGLDDGETYSLHKFCVKMECKQCGKKFRIPKFWPVRDGKDKYKRCNDCRINVINTILEKMFKTKENESI